MASKATVKSVEPNIADLVNGWLKSYKVDYKLEQESLNTEIDQALNDYFSKNGGKGGNRPDAKLLLRADDGKYDNIRVDLSLDEHDGIQKLRNAFDRQEVYGNGNQDGIRGGQ